MAYYLVKVAVSAALIVLISELAKRSSLAGAVLASIPAVSVLAFLWIYWETRDVARIAQMSQEIFWLVLPSLVLFILLPLLLRAGWSFWWSLLAGLAATVAAYALMLLAMKRFGVTP